MGAENQTYRVKAKNLTDLKEKYNELVEEACFYHGHGGYTGTIAESPGLTVTSQVLSESEAEDWLFDNAKKWEDTLAVKIKDTEEDWILGGCYSC
jgi:hypothetical protein